MVIRMKKIISIFIFLLLLVGCSLSNSPTSKVEDLLTKYQTLDKDIVNGIYWESKWVLVKYGNECLLKSEYCIIRACMYHFLDTYFFVVITTECEIV